MYFNLEVKNMKTREELRNQAATIWSSAPKVKRCKHDVAVIGGRKYSERDLYQLAAAVAANRYGNGRFR